MDNCLPVALPSPASRICGGKSTLYSQLSPIGRALGDDPTRRDAEPRASYQTAFQRANFIRRDRGKPSPYVIPLLNGDWYQHHRLGLNHPFYWKEIDYPKWTRRVYANRTRNRATGKNRLFTASSERGDKSSRFPNLCRKPTPPQRMSFLLF